MQLQVLSPHFDKGVRNYLQIPFRDGFFLHTELQVLHFPEEEKRHKEQSVTEIDQHPNSKQPLHMGLPCTTKV